MFTRVFTLAAVLGFITVPASRATALPDGCGNASVQFKVKTEKPAPSLGTVPAGAAQLIFVQSLDGAFAGAPVTRFAVDGSWVGADKGESYFEVTVQPGLHKICAARQSGIALERDNVGAATVHVEAGKTYFFNFKISRDEIGPASAHPAGQLLGYSSPDMTAKRQDTVDSAVFQPMDNSAGTSRTQKMALSIGTPK